MKNTKVKVEIFYLSPIYSLKIFLNGTDRLPNKGTYIDERLKSPFWLR